MCVPLGGRHTNNSAIGLAFRRPKKSPAVSRAQFLARASGLGGEPNSGLANDPERGLSVTRPNELHNNRLSLRNVKCWMCSNALLLLSPIESLLR